MSTIPVGSLAFYDQNSFKLAFRQSDGTVLSDPSPNPTMGAGDCSGLAQMTSTNYGVVGLYDSTADELTQFYDDQLAIVASYTDATDVFGWVGPDRVLLCEITSSATRTLREIDETGTENRSWGLSNVNYPDPSIPTRIQIQDVAMNPARTIAYIVKYKNGTTSPLTMSIYRHDLSIDTPLGDWVDVFPFASGGAFGSGIVVLASGDVIVAYSDGVGPTPISGYAKRYNSSGSTQATYDLGAPFLPGWLISGLDDTSFWIKGYTANDLSTMGVREIRVSDGTELQSFDFAPDAGGVDWTWPFCVVRVQIGTVPLALTFPDTTGRVGEPYSAFLVASGGTAPYGPYAITVGTLPGGLTLNASTGEISGTPTTEEIQPFTAEVTDDNADTAPCACFIRILAAAGPVDLNADTWVYDATEGQWHQRAGYDAGDDVFTRWRARGVAAVGSKVIVGDFETGDLYILDMDTFTDNDDAIKRLRRTPYLSTENQWLFIDRVELGIQPGVGNIDDPDPQVSLSISRDSGVTYSTPTDTSMGATGDDNAVAIWRALGRSRADRFVMQVTSTAQVRQVWGPGLWLKVRQGTGQR